MYIASLFIVLLPLVADLPPEGAKTYAIHFSDGRVAYGSVEELGVQTKIVFDTPWEEQPPATVLNSRITEMSPERGDARRKRVEQEWTRRGFVQTQTKTGSQYVQKTELELAKRADELSAAQELRLHPEPAQGAAATAATHEARPTIPWKQYLGEAAIIVLGLALAWFVVKTMVLD